MPDGSIKIRKGNIEPVQASMTLSTGNLTIVSSPLPTATIRDAIGTILSGFSGVTVNAYSTTASSTVTVTKNVDTTGPLFIAGNTYSIQFSVQTNGSDGLPRTYNPTIFIYIIPALF